MSIIARAMKKNVHISNNVQMNKQNWEEFEKIAAGKKVFLFGVGAGMEYFFTKYGEFFKIEGIIDNDDSKQGFCLSNFISEVVPNAIQYMSIQDDKILEEYDAEEVIVLITSLYFYQEIAEQLKKKQIKNVYAVLTMEANYRLTHGYECYENMDKNAYAKKCCEKEIQKNKIIFVSFGTYSDHGKYITEALLKRTEQLDIVWMLDDLREPVPKGVRVVYKKNWRNYIYEMETAYIWVINTMVPEYIVKREDQIYIHTKHWASITLKKFYLDADTILTIPGEVENWKENGKWIDYIITGSEFDTNSCRRGFAFEREVIQIGSPRTDAMFHQKQMKEKVYEKYGIEENAKLLLYAPTYRYKSGSANREHETRNIQLNYEEVKNTLENKFGGTWYIMLRLHPSQANQSRNVERPKFVIDGSFYYDSQELAAACDIMITDYSSIMFEPAFVKKPVFLFATDKDTYIDKEYNLLIQYDTLPFPIAESNEELLERISDFDVVKYNDDIMTFLNKYQTKEDGHASERAAEFLLKLL